MTHNNGNTGRPRGLSRRKGGCANRGENGEEDDGEARREEVEHCQRVRTSQAKGDEIMGRLGKPAYMLCWGVFVIWEEVERKQVVWNERKRTDADRGYDRRRVAKLVSATTPAANCGQLFWQQGLAPAVR